MRARERSVLNAVMIYAIAGQPLDWETLSHALDLRAKVHAVKRNGRNNAKGCFRRAIILHNELKKRGM